MLWDEPVNCPVTKLQWVLLEKATCLHGPLALYPKGDLNLAFVLPNLLYTVCLIVGSELKPKGMRSPSVFFTLNSEQSHNPIFWLTFPTALPPCRHQHSFPKRVHFLQWNVCMHAHTNTAHTCSPISNRHAAVTTFTVWQENKSACTWISARQSKARWLL